MTLWRKILIVLGILFSAGVIFFCAIILYVLSG
jgi:hypothetical protein